MTCCGRCSTRRGGSTSWSSIFGGIVGLAARHLDGRRRILGTASWVSAGRSTGVLCHELRVLDRHQPRGHADFGHPQTGECRLAPAVIRCAEVITVFALMIGALFPIIHLGRPWLAFWLFPYPSERMIWPNFRSPLVWDFFAINTDLTGSVLFLPLPIIPDFAVVRDKSTGLRRRHLWCARARLARHAETVHRLETAMEIMAIAIIPGRRFGAHDRVVRLLDGAGAHVEHHDLRA